APETFDGWVSRFSDQYSLAIVYQEVLTGQRPFNGTTMRQLVLQHLQSAPDLSPMPVGDRPAVTKALSKNPDQRFPTGLDFVKALRPAVRVKEAAAARVPADGSPTLREAPAASPLPARPSKEPATTPSMLEVEQTQHHGGRRPQRPDRPDKKPSVATPSKP